VVEDRIVPKLNPDGVAAVEAEVLGVVNEENVDGWVVVAVVVVVPKVFGADAVVLAFSFQIVVVLDKYEQNLGNLLK